ncbi:MAG TPA: 4-hydroxy-3-methylbut-2-enyl diphosphate reductase [Candidatus Nanoarchaeia archaeon]|nr:4-hydroxy-3-methylbut-2-enyl diphosphate reductase [Candidatus Nanoarchaeia archaeon]
MPIQKVILAKPRGFCAGVERAIQVVEECLEIFGKPVYVKHEIVHNKHVVERLTQKGAITVENVSEIPSGMVAVFSAHGSPPEHYELARKKGIRIIDATCPLVTRVHIEVHRFAQEGYQIIYIGHKGHAEALGILGELPERIALVETVEDVEKLEIGHPTKLVYLTQTTLSVDDTKQVIAAIKKKYPQTMDPPGEDICYATTNRQAAVKELTKYAQLILVIGSKSSSNSNRLVETARTLGTKAYLIDDLNGFNPAWLKNISIVGIASGASAPDHLVQELVEYFVKQGAKKEELTLLEEKVTFKLPRELMAFKTKEVHS